LDIPADWPGGNIVATATPAFEPGLLESEAVALEPADPIGAAWLSIRWIEEAKVGFPDEGSGNFGML
jgi:hypothetical protein